MHILNIHLFPQAPAAKWQIRCLPAFQCSIINQNYCFITGMFMCIGYLLGHVLRLYNIQITWDNQSYIPVIQPSSNRSRQTYLITQSAVVRSSITNLYRPFFCIYVAFHSLNTLPVHTRVYKFNFKFRV